MMKFVTSMLVNNSFSDMLCKACMKCKHQKGGSQSVLRGKVITTCLPGYETSDLHEYYQINRDKIMDILKERLNIENL